MSEKNVPDKATEFDDDLDVPTYSPGSASDGAATAEAAAATEAAEAIESAGGAAAQPEEGAKPQRSRVFQRAGRAEPQEIKARTDKAAGREDAPKVPAGEADAKESSETEVFERGPLSFESGTTAAAETTAFPQADEPEAGAEQAASRSTDDDYDDSDFAPAGAAAAGGAGLLAGASVAAAGKGGVPQDEAETSLDVLEAEEEERKVQAARAATSDTGRKGEATEETEEEKSERLKAEQAKRDGYRTYGRRGTIDFGLLFVRLALGVYLLIAGATTFFKLDGGEGLSGLEADFNEQGYAMASALSIGVPTLQLIAGVFLLLGLITPLAAMFGLIVTGFAAIHEVAVSGKGLDLFAWPSGVWLGLVLFVIALALQFTGPGFISLDFKQSWARRPLATSWIFVLLGVAALVGVWWFGAGVNPLS